MTVGMLAMRNTKPLSIKNGSMKKKTVIMACCCVAEMVDMNSPIPKVLKRNRHVAPIRRREFHLSGRENQKMTKVITIIMSVWVIMIYGIVFP